MSITVTTDVFCDVCSEWIEGVSAATYGNVAGQARGIAYAQGWRRIKLNGKLSDVCPRCLKRSVAELEQQLKGESDV